MKDLLTDNPLPEGRICTYTIREQPQVVAYDPNTGRCFALVDQDQVPDGQTDYLIPVDITNCLSQRGKILTHTSGHSLVVANGCPRHDLDATSNCRIAGVTSHARRV